MKRWPLTLTLPVLLWAMPAAAGDPPEAHSSLIDTLELPAAAQAARDAGVPTEEVGEALEGAKKKGADSTDVREALETGAEAAREHGPVDNFGAFVTARLDEGLRGQDLAAAIRAEHEANGKGRPEGAGPPEGKGKPDDAGPPEGKGKPDEAGAPEGKGKPADAGAPADAGSKPAATGSHEGKGKASSGAMKRPK